VAHLQIVQLLLQVYHLVSLEKKGKKHRKYLEVVLKLLDVQFLLILLLQLLDEHLVRFLGDDVFNGVAPLVVRCRNTCMAVFPIGVWDLQASVVALRTDLQVFFGLGKLSLKVFSFDNPLLSLLEHLEAGLARAIFDSCGVVRRGPLELGSEQLVLRLKLLAQLLISFSVGSQVFELFLQPLRPCLELVQILTKALISSVDHDGSLDLIVALPDFSLKLGDERIQPLYVLLIKLLVFGFLFLQVFD